MDVVREADRASLAELGYCLHVARRLGYIDEHRFEALNTAVKRAAAALNGYIQALKDGRVP